MESAGTGTSRQWVAAAIDREQAATLAGEMGLSGTIASLLWLRGLRDSESAAAFLDPSLLSLHDPGEIPDLLTAAKRIDEVRRDGGSIGIYGDYDVDGISSTALLVQAFAVLGTEVCSYIPDRLTEGYGLNSAAIEKLADDGVDLVITVDGGSNDIEELEVARDRGMEVVVTDHHPIHRMPEGVLLVHPDRPDVTSSSRGLSGVGVAYKLAWALGLEAARGDRVSEEYRAFLTEALGLVALGTVADVVDLQGENRVLVRHGLGAISRSTSAGLSALLDVCGVDRSHLSATDIGFRIAPHLNAAGRLGRAGEALELLLSDQFSRSRELASALAGYNRKRREIEKQMVADCIEELSDGRHPPEGPLVFAREGWHVGVAGIVAARIVDRCHRPVFVIALDDEIGRGSGRSIDEIPLTPFYEPARKVVTTIGGHACAGGVTLIPDQVGAFRSELEKTAFEISEAGAPPPVRYYDLDIDPSELDLSLALELEGLQPFGAGNREPLIRIDNLELDGAPRLVGRGEEHVQLLLRGGGRRVRGIWFRGASRVRELTASRKKLSLIAAIEVNRFRGESSVQLRIEDLLPAEGDNS